MVVASSVAVAAITLFAAVVTENLDIKIDFVIFVAYVVVAAALIAVVAFDYH